MKENEKRIPLTHGTAVVDKDVSPETVEALNNLVKCAYKQKSKSLRLSPVVESSNCVHYGIIDLGYSDLFWCEDCRNKVIRIEDCTRASGYRMEIKK